MFFYIEIEMHAERVNRIRKKESEGCILGNWIETSCIIVRKAKKKNESTSRAGAYCVYKMLNAYVCTRWNGVGKSFPLNAQSIERFCVNYNA